MHEYRPRGIVKWAPFAALTDYTDAVQELYAQLAKEEIEGRNSEFEEYLDNCLNQIIINTSDVYIKYQIGNDIFETSGIVTFLDPDSIEINGIIIKKEQITDIIV